MAEKKWCDPEKRRAIEAKWIPEFQKVTFKTVTFKFHPIINPNWEMATPQRVKACLEAFVHLEYNGKIKKFSNRKLSQNNNKLFDTILSLLGVPSGQRPFLRRTRQLSTHFDTKVILIHNHLLTRLNRASRTKAHLRKLDRILRYGKREDKVKLLKETMHRVAGVLCTQDVNRIWKEVQKERVVSGVMET